VIAMKYVVLGSTLEGLLLSLELAKLQHEVVLIDIEAEIGMPIQHPSRIINPDLLDVYFSKSEQRFLSLHDNVDGWGCRWEWVMKFLAHQVARHGVQCLTRTRVLGSETENQQIALLLSTHERHQPEKLVADAVINMPQQNPETPGRHQHVLESLHTVWFPSTPCSLWHGRTFLTNPPPQFTQPPVFQLRRNDGLIEVWWKLRPDEPSTGTVIERCEVHLPTNAQDVSFDAAVKRVHRFVETFCERSH
jgi:hypothetical protein